MTTARRIRLRRDSTTNWEAGDPILDEGEIGVDMTLGAFKLGDGTTAWSGLPYFTDADSASGAPSYSQTFTGSSVVITHNLGFRPNVQMIDSAGDSVVGQITHNTANQLTLTFSASFTGTAYLS